MALLLGECFLALSSFPAINPNLAIGLFMLLPALSLGVNYFTTIKQHKCLDWKLTVALYYHDNCARIVVRTLILTFLLALNQVSYSYQTNLTFSYDPNYYSQVDSTLQNTVDTVFFAKQYSLASTSTSSHRQLGSIQSIGYINRILEYSDGHLALIYHTSNFDSLLHTNYFNQICKLEQNIFHTLPCLNRNTIDSIIPSVFNTSSCTKKANVHSSFYSLYKNKDYLQDNINYLSANSSVVITYFDSSSCDQLSLSQFQSQINSYTKGTSIQITIVDHKFIQSDVMDSISDSYNIMWVALLVAGAFMIFGFRGILTTIAVFYSLLISVISAIAVVPNANFQSFSILNIFSIYVLIAIGCVALFLYGSAWRRAFPAGAHITGRRLKKAYQLISLATLFVFSISFFLYLSQTSSPIIVYQQFAIFIATSYLLFFSMVHLFVIPIWICLSYYNIFPASYRKQFENSCEIQIIHDYGKNNFYDEDDDNDAYEEFVLDANVDSYDSLRALEQAILASLREDKCKNSYSLNRESKLVIRESMQRRRDSMNGLNSSTHSYHSDTGAGLSSQSPGPSRRPSLQAMQSSQGISSHSINNSSNSTPVMSGPPVHPTMRRTSLQNRASGDQLNESRNSNNSNSNGTPPASPIRRQSTGSAETSSSQLQLQQSSRELAYTQRHIPSYTLGDSQTTRMQQNPEQSQSLHLSTGRPPLPKPSNGTARDLSTTSAPLRPMSLQITVPSCPLNSGASISRNQSEDSLPNYDVDNRSQQKHSPNQSSPGRFSRRNSGASVFGAFSTTNDDINDNIINRRFSIMTQAQSVFFDEIDTRALAKARARYFGVISFALLIVVMIFVGYFGTIRIAFDGTAPIMFCLSTNLGQAMYIQKHFKTNIITSYSVPSAVGIAYTSTPSAVPSRHPSVVPVSRRPTTTPSRLPTISPSASLPPQASPTTSPSVQTTPLTAAQQQIGSVTANNYLMTGCYGATQQKAFLDQPVSITWNAASFRAYSLSQGLFYDLKKICDNVEANQIALKISPSWRKYRDCVYYQLVATNETLSQLSTIEYESFFYPYWGLYSQQEAFKQVYWSQSLLLYWSYLYSQDDLLGVKSVVYSDVNAPLLMPVYICANFSIQDSSVMNIGNVKTMINSWKYAYDAHSANANKLGINMVVASEVFSSPIFQDAVQTTLSSVVQYSFMLFVAFLLLYTQSFSLTFLTTISLFNIVIFTIVIKSGVISDAFDIYDILAIMSTFGFIAAFLSHFLYHFFNDSDHLKILYYKPNGYEDETELLWTLPNSLIYTWRYSLRSFWVPCLMMIFVGVILLPSHILLFQNVGYYFIIVSIVSFTYTLTVFPFILGISVRFSYFDVDWAQFQINCWDYGAKQTKVITQHVTCLCNYLQSFLCFLSLAKSTDPDRDSFGDYEHDIEGHLPYDRERRVAIKRVSTESLSRLDSTSAEADVNGRHSLSHDTASETLSPPTSPFKPLLTPTHTNIVGTQAELMTSTTSTSMLPRMARALFQGGRPTKQVKATTSLIPLSAENLKRIEMLSSRPCEGYSINTFLSNGNRHQNASASGDDESKSISIPDRDSSTADTEKNTLNKKALQNKYAKEFSLQTDAILKLSDTNELDIETPVPLATAAIKRLSITLFGSAPSITQEVEAIKEVNPQSVLPLTLPLTSSRSVDNIPVVALQSTKSMYLSTKSSAAMSLFEASFLGSSSRSTYYEESKKSAYNPSSSSSAVGTRTVITAKENAGNLVATTNPNVKIEMEPPETSDENETNEESHLLVQPNNASNYTANGSLRESGSSRSSSTILGDGILNLFELSFLSKSNKLNASQEHSSREENSSLIKENFKEEVAVANSQQQSIRTISKRSSPQVTPHVSLKVTSQGPGSMKIMPSLRASNSFRGLQSSPRISPRSSRGISSPSSVYNTPKVTPLSSPEQSSEIAMSTAHYSDNSLSLQLQPQLMLCSANDKQHSEAESPSQDINTQNLAQVSAVEAITSLMVSFWSPIANQNDSEGDFHVDTDSVVASSLISSVSSVPAATVQTDSNNKFVEHQDTEHSEFEFECKSNCASLLHTNIIQSLPARKPDSKFSSPRTPRSRPSSRDSSCRSGPQTISPVASMSTTPRVPSHVSVSPLTIPSLKFTPRTLLLSCQMQKELEGNPITEATKQQREDISEERIADSVSNNEPVLCASCVVSEKSDTI